MKKVIMCLSLITGVLFMLTSCETKEPTETVTETVEAGEFKDVWNEEYQDNESRFNENSVVSNIAMWLKEELAQDKDT